MADLVQNDIGCALVVTCYDQDNNIINLADTSVELHYYIESYPPIYVRNMTITDPANGKVEYKFSTYTDANQDVVADLNVPGILRYRVVITFADETKLTSPFDGTIVIHPTLDSE